MWCVLKWFDFFSEAEKGHLKHAEKVMDDDEQAGGGMGLNRACGGGGGLFTEVNLMKLAVSGIFCLLINF